MARPVSADHVLFNEAIEAFRPPAWPNTNFDETGIRLTPGGSSSYVLLSFALEDELRSEHFQVLPSQEFSFSHSPLSSFIAIVNQPEWTDKYAAHLYSHAVGAILSFVAQRPVKSVRDYTSHVESRRDSDLLTVAVQLPIITAGTGFYDTGLSGKSLHLLQKEVEEVSAILYGLPLRKYHEFIQAIRLVQLAHLFKRDDFATSYFLIVSAIESIAQLAIKRKAVVEKPTEQEAHWADLVKAEQAKPTEITALHKAYQDLKAKDNLLGKRFTEFILKFCPVSMWEELEHPFENRSAYLKEKFDQSFGIDLLTKKSLFEVYPDQLDEEKIRTILKDVYNHRSAFTHRGESPPHHEPKSWSRYFQEQYQFNSDTGEGKNVILPNFELMAFIAKNSILNYFREYIRQDRRK